MTGSEAGVPPKVSRKAGIQVNYQKKGERKEGRKEGRKTADRLDQTHREVIGCNGSECIAHPEVDVMAGG